MISFLIRLVLLVIARFLAGYIIQKKSIVIKKKTFSILATIIIVLVFVVFPEKYFLRFNNIRVAARYSLIYPEIRLTYENEDFGFVLYNRDNVVKYIPKKNGKYMAPERANIAMHTPYTADSKYEFYIDKNMITKKTFIVIEPKDSDLPHAEITDSLGNTFSSAFINDREYYFLLIDKLNTKYSVIIDNKYYRLSDYLMLLKN